MNDRRVLLILLLAGLIGAATAADARAGDGVGGDSSAMPAPEVAQRGEGKRGKRKRKKGGDGVTDAGPPMLDGQTTLDALDRETLCGIGRSKKCDIQVAIKLGLFETGLEPVFPEGLECRGIDETWAMDYSAVRNRVNYHGGIDMPAPWGTPMIAAAAGTVVSKSFPDMSYRGREIILRHSPDDTGLPVWVYTQYAHFDAMPKVEIGQRVKMGQDLGPTGNSGIDRRTRQQSNRRRPAIHFAVWFSESPNYVLHKDKIFPVDGQWMDPNALYRGKMPLDSYAMKALPESEKKVAIPVMLEDGTAIPADTKVVWPYTCKRN